MKFFKRASLLLLFSTKILFSQSVTDVMTPSEKIYGLSKVWKEIQYNYAFIDKVKVDIDSLYKATIPKILKAKNNYEYLHYLVEFMSHFKYGHTAIWTNQFYYDGTDLPPFEYKNTNGNYIITKIDKSLVNEVPIGSILLSLDGYEIDKAPKLYYNIARNLIGYKNSSLDIKFKKPNGEIITKRITRNYNVLWKEGKINMISKTAKSNLNNTRKSEEFSLKITSQNIAIVEINSFRKESVVEKFKDAIESINSTNGLIIDVRENGGGNGDYAVAIAKHLVKQNYLLTESWKTRMHNAAKKAYGSINLTDSTNSYARKYKRYFTDYSWEYHPSDTLKIENHIQKINIPVVVLTGKNTYSAAEDFIIYLYNDKSIKRFGNHTAGNSGQPLSFNLPGGYLGKIAAKRDALPDGTDYIGTGIKPDFIIEKRETILQRAIDYLLNKKEKN